MYAFHENPPKKTKTPKNPEFRTPLEGVIYPSTPHIHLYLIFCQNLPSFNLPGIERLVEMLDTKTIDGFVMDKYELMLFYQHFQHNQLYKHTVEYVRKKCLLTEIPHSDQLMYGIIVKQKRDYDFLVDFIRSNMDVINSCTDLFLTNYTRRTDIVVEKISLFSIDGGMFWPSLTACGVVIGVIVACGAGYEGWRRFRRLGVKSCLVGKHNEKIISLESHFDG